MKFQVIPVIDVRHGVAVRAVAGDRANYRPLTSPLSASADPGDVARGLMALAAFPVIYAADLDGIEGRGADTHLATRIAEATGAEIWLDRGMSPRDYRAKFAVMSATDVLSSEACWHPDALAAMTEFDRRRAVLSLDFRGSELIGDARLLGTPELWPPRVIVMTLARVGRAGGPDFERIEDVARRAQTLAVPPAIYAAGGVRDRADLDALAQAGVSGALVASALHAKTITAADLL